MNYTPECDRCGKRFPLPISKKELPAMVGFQMDDGRTINICKYCLMKLGSLKTDEEKDDFFRSID